MILCLKLSIDNDHDNGDDDGNDCYNYVLEKKIKRFHINDNDAVKATTLQLNYIFL